MKVKKLDKVGQEIFEKRYAYVGETTYQDRCRVMAHSIASAEKDEEKQRVEDYFYDILSTGDFVPGGRIIYGSGRNSGKQNLLNCYLLDPEDSVESIGKIIQDTYKISCAGGGIGFNFSKIRPKGDDIQHNKHSAPGSVSVMRMINEIGNHVRAGGNRRTALMSMLNVTHPDILEFLHVKLDKKELNNFNISVAITNRFLEAVKANEEWYFTFGNKKYYVYELNKNPIVVDHPCDERIKVIALNEQDAIERANECHKTDFRDTFSFPKKVEYKARELWDMIWTNAVKSGDPGIFNIDLVNEYTNVSYFERLHGSNPCITGDTKILTINGPVSIKELADGNCPACNGEGNHGEHPHNGDILDCNTCNGTGRTDKKYIKLFAWDPDSKLPVIRTGIRPHCTARNAELLEIEFDSGLKVRCTPNHNFRTFRGDKIEAKDLTVGKSLRAFSISKHRDGHIRAHGWVAGKTMHQWVHRMVWEEANGEIPEGYVIHHKDGNPENNVLENLELLNAYDHQSEHYAERLEGGFVNPKTNPEKWKQLVTDHTNHKILSIRSAGREDVYNIMVTDAHTYIIVDPEYKGDGVDGVWSGIVSCNCGEVSLPNFGNCCLGNINLSNMVVDGQFDWKRFAKAVRYGVQFLDNVLEVNHFPIPECREGPFGAFLRQPPDAPARRQFDGAVLGRHIARDHVE